MTLIFPKGKLTQDYEHVPVQYRPLTAAECERLGKIAREKRKHPTSHPTMLPNSFHICHECGHQNPGYLGTCEVCGVDVTPSSTNSSAD